MKDEKVLRDIIFYILVFLVLITMSMHSIKSKKLDLESKEHRINELQNKVEQQYELIDTLQQ